MSKSILVVEDDADIRAALTSILIGEGYDVSTCANGLEALQQLRSGQHPDMILLDLMMPVMDGWQFRVHQKQDPRLANIPVLAISANATPKAAAIDADAYLHKPVDCDVLLGAIERTLLTIERKRLQATLVETERLASLGTLAAGIAHEINNPLAFVMANLGFVAQAVEALPIGDVSQIRDALTETVAGCERIRTIVRDLQLFSRKREDDNREVDVRRVLDSSANIVMSEIRPRARLTRHYDDVPPLEVSEARLGQVFLNLVLNAAQAIPEGDAANNEIRLSARTEGRYVVVEVRDTGAGIPPEVRGRIFDPFFTTKPIGVGTGLGLSISHRIISAMGGEVTVDSVPGRGSTFQVRLPRSLPSSRRQPVARVHEAPLPRRARLLVIDDEELIGTTLARILGPSHDVEVVTNPDRGVERIVRGDRFDLILCDLMMPQRSGMDVHAAILEASPDQAARMLFLTGGAFSDAAREFLSDHEHDVLEKPFSVDGVMNRVNAALASFEG
ncbi:MAG TPA: response regulator, partial [Polyangiaceae bacterium]